jgi:hypothetical protein
MLKQPNGWRDLIPPLAEPQADHGVAVRKLIRDLFDHDQLPVQIDAWLAFAGLARRLNDDVLSRDIETRLIAQFPDDPRAQLLGAARLRTSGDIAGARAVLDRVLAGGKLPREVRDVVAAELAGLGDPKAAAQAIAHPG